MAPARPQPYLLAWLYVAMRTDDAQQPEMDREARLGAGGSLRATLDALVAKLE